MSNKELQRQTWIEGSVPIYISSFWELINGLGDMRFESFVTTDARDSGFDEKIIIELDKLKCMLSIYNSKDKSDKHILKDPKWDIIIQQAKVVMDLFFKKNPLNIYTWEGLRG